MADRLIPQDVGLTVINNANAGGILVQPAYFKAGDSGANPTAETLTDILGAVIVQGNLHHVEVLSQRSCRFVFDLDGSGLTEPTDINEVGVYTDAGIMLGRCVFEEPHTLLPNEAYRVSVILTTTRADLSVISVVVGDYDSIPSTSHLFRLPSPYSSQFNVISVLNGMRNEDGTDSPVLAMRYGAGAYQWGFTGHSRVFNGIPSSVNGSDFKIPTIGTTFVDKEYVIVHCVSGAGIGQTRRYYYNASTATFVDADSRVIADLDTSNIVIWKRNGGASGGTTTVLPDTDNVPPDWVLTPGNNGEGVWAPPKTGAKVLNTLYTPPSRMEISALNYIGTGNTARFSLGDLIAENENYVYAALGGITQHRGAFELNASELEFAEKLQAGLPVDLRVFTKTSSTGTRMEFTSSHFTGDGTTRKFTIPVEIADTQYAFVYVRGILQQVTAYTFDRLNKQIVFVEPPPPGVEIAVRCAVVENVTGYSTRIVTRTYMTNGDTLYLPLPLTPQSKEQVFVSQSGVHVHDNLYQIVGDNLVLSGSLQHGIEVEVLIFDNVLAQGSENYNLKGVVVDGYVTYKNLRLLRHGAKPLTLPIPSPNFEPGRGIRISGEFPTFRFENTLADSAVLNPIRKHNNITVEKNTSENRFVQRIECKTDLLLFVTADFAVELGPGFVSPAGMENIEFVVGISTPTSREPDFGRRIRGTGRAGFSALPGNKNEVAYSNASLTQVFELVADNHPAGFVDVVAKVRVNNANTGQFGSLVSINLNVLEIPRWEA